ncbi:MAG: succinylglutamate desuccinylase/aspartoacylase family protein [Marinilabiliaceae bacterium]|jgi:predicted deacylase|nr:succinylglutamate desuccinylase/aspartoacylase family protein [Marinilabiliaceae bacterium]
MLILDRKIAKGEGAVLELEVARLHTRNSIKISIIVQRAKTKGPTILLMGGIHGDEINGVAIVRDIIRKKYNIPDRGTIICIPVFNVFGYLNLSRNFPDGRDLNRMFPGSSNGSLASQFAYQFTNKIAPLVDYVIDFHTGGSQRYNFPNVRCVIKEEEEFKLAKAFGAPFIINSNYIAKSVRETIHKLGKTGILFEGGKSQLLDEEVVDAGVAGAVNVMKHLGILKGRPGTTKNQVLIQDAKWIRAPFSGMLRLHVKNGIRVRKRTMLAEITDSFGEFEKKVLAPVDCYIYGINTAPIVNKGDALFHIGTQIPE